MNYRLSNEQFERIMVSGSVWPGAFPAFEQLAGDPAMMYRYSSLRYAGTADVSMYNKQEDGPFPEYGRGWLRCSYCGRKHNILTGGNISECLGCGAPL